MSPLFNNFFHFFTFLRPMVVLIFSAFFGVFNLVTACLTMFNWLQLFDHEISVVQGLRNLKPYGELGRLINTPDILNTKMVLKRANETILVAKREKKRLNSIVSTILLTS